MPARCGRAFNDDRVGFPATGAGAGWARHGTGTPLRPVPGHANELRNLVFRRRNVAVPVTPPTVQLRLRRGSLDGVGARRHEGPYRFDDVEDGCHAKPLRCPVENATARMDSAPRVNASGLMLHPGTVVFPRRSARTRETAALCEEERLSLPETMTCIQRCRG